MPGTLNLTNELPKTKHSLNINMGQWVLRSRVNICKETRIHKHIGISNNKWPILKDNRSMFYRSPNMCIRVSCSL